MPHSTIGPRFFRDHPSRSIALLATGIVLAMLAAPFAPSKATPPNHAYSEAEWISTPGYPINEPGSPFELATMAVCDIALVDMDGDPELEIVFNQLGSTIDVMNPDGSYVPGWPVYLETLDPFYRPAIGDLNGDGSPTLIAVGYSGKIFAFDPHGQLAPGWPIDVGTGSVAHVTIGALGGPYPRTIVVASKDRIEFFNYRGAAVPEAPGYTIPDGREVAAPATVGDVDGDGVAEAVVVANGLVVALELTESTPTFTRILSEDSGSAPALVDLDLDGDVEVVVAANQSMIFVLNDDGSDFPGWPVQAGGIPRMLKGPAIAQIVPGGPPEIVIVGADQGLYVFQSDGTAVEGFPAEYGTPWKWHVPVVIGEIDGNAHIILGSRSAGEVVAWDDIGDISDGWPLELLAPIQFAGPVLGDIDNDGSLEMVVATGDLPLLDDPRHLFIFDLNTPSPPADRMWPMHGYDPQRTSCFNCVEDIATTVEVERLASSISFAAPLPNPMSTATVFHFAVPAGTRVTRVTLEIYDVRGRRIKTVLRKEFPAGEHEASWNGRNEQNTEVATGTYFARLSVEGSSYEGSITRKVTVVR